MRRTVLKFWLTTSLVCAAVAGETSSVRAL